MARLRTRAIFECCKWDLQVGDVPTLARYALTIDSAEWQHLAALAERLTAELHEAVREIMRSPALVEMLGVPRGLRAALDGAPNPSGVREVRFARFDFHPTLDGWRLSEVNADVPGGFIEASALPGMFSEHLAATASPGNPAEALAAALTSRVRSGHVALVHATGYSDDRQTMLFLARVLERSGYRCTLVSPTHIRWKQGAPRRITDESPIDAMVRFFPLEWLPALGDSCEWQFFCAGSQAPISNPGEAILGQSKRFPLVWKHLRAGLSAWKTVLPETREPLDIDGDPRSWVFKPAFGRVGMDVALAGAIPDRAFDALVERSQREARRWVAQRRFESIVVHGPDGDCYPCLGVFTVDGRAAG